MTAARYQKQKCPPVTSLLENNASCEAEARPPSCSHRSKGTLPAAPAAPPAAPPGWFSGPGQLPAPVALRHRSPCTRRAPLLCHLPASTAAAAWRLRRGPGTTPASSTSRDTHRPVQPSARALLLGAHIRERLRGGTPCPVLRSCLRDGQRAGHLHGAQSKAGSFTGTLKLASCLAPTAQAPSSTGQRKAQTEVGRAEPCTQQSQQQTRQPHTTSRTAVSKPCK